MRPAYLVALPALLAVVAPAASAQEERTGVFNRLQQAAGQRVLFLSGGTSYPVPADVYERHKALLDGLKAGDAIRYTLRQGQLASVRRKDEAADPARRRALTGRFESLSPPNGGRYWLKLQDNSEFQVSDEVYQRFSRVLQFLHRGDPVRLLVEGGWVLEVAESKSGKEIDPVLEERVRMSQSGDLVTVRGEPFLFLGANLTEMRLRPRVPNTDPPEWVKEGVTVEALETLRAEDFVNERVGERRVEAATTGRAADVFTAERIRVGDLVGIDLDEGQIVALDEEGYKLLVWRNDEWAPPPLEGQRATVKAVSPVALASRLVVPLQGSEVTARVTRRHLAREGPLAFEVEVGHALTGQLLVGAKLRLLLSDAPGMTPDTTPTWTEEVPLPVLFEGQPVKLTAAAGQDAALDGRAELVIPADGVVSLASPQAKAHVLGAIEHAGRDVEALQRAYVAAGKNADPELVALLVSRAQTTSAEVSPGHRAALIAGLDASGAVAPRVILDIIAGADRGLEVVRLDRGQLKAGPPPRDENPVAYKRRLVALLGELEAGIRGDAARRLLDLDRSRDDLGEPVVATFARHPADAVTSLVQLATATTPASTEDELTRAEKAAALLQRLGEAVVPDLLRELRRRELPAAEVDALQKAAEQEGASLRELIGKALAAISDEAARRKRAQLDATVEQARGLASEKKWAEAAPMLREVLLQDPEHAAARELTPSVLTRLAEQLAPQDRAGAGALLREAIPLLQGAEQTRAKTALAELALAALSEEVEEVVVRETPDDLGRRLQAATRDASFTGNEVVSGWVEMPLPGAGDRKGYLRVKCLRQQGPDRWTVADSATPYDVIDGRATELAALSNAVGAGLNELLGRLCAREAQAKFESEDFRGALPFFNRARELAPTDPRLASYTKCWLMAYKMHLATVGGILALVVALGLFQSFAKPKRVKFEGDFKYYGANRSQRERDLDVSGDGTGDAGAPPAGDAGGAPPADAPPGGTPS